MILFPIAALVAVLALGAAQPLGGVPGWYRLPNTKIHADKTAQGAACASIAYLPVNAPQSSETCSSVCPDPARFPSVIGANGEGCSGVINDFSGAAFDTLRNRLYIRGGGHNGYAGNEIYALDLNALTMSRLYDPSTNPPTTCNNNGLMPDGKPQAYHTNNQMTYVASIDRMFENEGSDVPCGGTNAQSFLFNPNDNTWQNLGNPGAFPSNAWVSFGLNTIYDPSRDLVFSRDEFRLRAFDPKTKGWSVLSGSDPNPPPNIDFKEALIDPKRHHYLYQVPGNSTIWYYDISPASFYALQTLSTSGCAAFTDSTEQGWQYDPVLDRYVAYLGTGDSVILMNPDTGACSTPSYPNGPAFPAGAGTAHDNGTYGRFQYVAQGNFYVMCGASDMDCYALRLSPAADALAPAAPKGLAMR